MGYAYADDILDPDVQVMKFDGLCPFICFEEGPHSHPICPKCGAVNYGNAFCDECRRNKPY